MSVLALDPSERLNTFVVEVSSDVEKVCPQWEALEKHGTAFQTRAWLFPWYRIIAPAFGATPVFVTIRDRATQQPVMFFPLCLRRRHGLKMIEFPDFGVCDYNSPLVSPDLDLGASDVRKLWAEICQLLPAADYVRFNKIPKTLRGRDNPIARLEGLNPIEMRAWAVHLPESREAYESLILKKDRKEQRRKKRNLTARMGELTLVHAATASEGQVIFEALRRERRARFEQTRRNEILENPNFLEFYRAMIFDNWGPHVVLSALKAGEKILATLFGLRQDDYCLILMHSFEPELIELSPGIVALDEMITHLIESGCRTLDFTIGNEEYKRQFGVQGTVLLSGMQPLSFVGRPYVDAYRYAEHRKEALKPLVRDGRKWLAGLRSRRAQ